MKFQDTKAQTKSEEYAEFKRLDSFFTNAGSPIQIPVADQSDAWRRYEQLHNYFYTR